MATPDTVLALVAGAYDEAAALAGKPTLAAQLAAKDADVSAANAARDVAIADRNTAQGTATALQSKIDASKAALARADAADVTEDQARRDALAALG